MVYSGTLVEWNDQRGFGFIAVDGGGERVFVHVSAFQPKPSVQSRPHNGLRVQFALGTEQGRKRAQQVRWSANITAQRQASHPAKSAAAGPSGRRGVVLYTLLLVFVLPLLVLAWLGKIAPQVLSLYAVMSLITFFAYWKDKMAAQAGRWRTPESTLHALALLGGWPGALLAQQWLRHKTSKTSFKWVFGLTVLVNIALLLYAHSPWGSDWLPVLHH